MAATLLVLLSEAAAAQSLPIPAPAPAPAPAAAAGEAVNEPPVAPKTVNVIPEVEDNEISERLQHILTATEWFQNCTVRVDQGVAFLEGQTADAKYKTWAGNLAQNTEDVVAVVNRIVVTEKSFWDLSPAWVQVQDMTRDMVQGLPLFGLAIGVLIFSWILTGTLAAWASRAIGRRVPNPILQQVGSRAVAIPFMLLGIFLALRICGLTQIAATVVGGTGLIGLIVGIAFRDITENFLASILISMQRPFQLADVIEVNGVQGVVQSVTTRGTLLMTLDGNHLQIPNSLIYKNVIRNLTANPKLRLSFSFPIPSGLSTEAVQKTVMDVLQHHPAVMKDPEPLVLAEEWTAAGVTARVYFWINGHQFSSAKVRSAIIRLANTAIRRLPPDGEQQNPDQHQTEHGPRHQEPNGQRHHKSAHSQTPSALDHKEHVGEGHLESERADIEKQAQSCPPVNEGQNLLAADGTHDQTQAPNRDAPQHRDGLVPTKPARAGRRFD